MTGFDRLVLSISLAVAVVCVVSGAILSWRRPGTVAQAVTSLRGAAGRRLGPALAAAGLTVRAGLRRTQSAALRSRTQTGVVRAGTAAGRVLRSAGGMGRGAVVQVRRGLAALAKPPLALERAVRVRHARGAPVVPVSVASAALAPGVAPGAARRAKAPASAPARRLRLKVSPSVEPSVHQSQVKSGRRKDDRAPRRRTGRRGPHDVVKIHVWVGYVSGEFYAITATQDGDEEILALSPGFRWLRKHEGTPPATGKPLQSFCALVERLEEDGWQRLENGYGRWFEQEFVRPSA